MEYLGYPVFILLGLILGSFSTFLIHRIPARLPWLPGAAKADVSPHRSACASCKTPLRLADLFPLLSWLFLRGRCRYCRAPISAMYPLVEAGCAVASLSVYMVWGASPLAFLLVACIPFLAALLVIDLRSMILPDILVFIVGALAGLRLGLEIVVFKTMALETGATEYLAGGLVFALFAWLVGIVLGRVLKKEALGFGDVKFFGVAGVWLGLHGLAWFCIASGVLGIALALVWRKVTKETIFPFGPALIASLFILLLLDGSLLP